ncbi:hypothetical protein MMC07_009800 [Pseudocyphellaria aurata]|nr:hypothetical protein [Pseudocyphellaria aurata]
MSWFYPHLDLLNPPALNSDDERYLEYFKAQYTERINRVLRKKAGFVCYGEPDDDGIYRISDPDSDHFDSSLNDGILPYLLNDTVFYQSLIPRIDPGSRIDSLVSLHFSSATEYGPDLVWEAFAVYAEEYVELQKGWGVLATSDQAGRILKGILTYDDFPGNIFCPHKFETLVQEIVRLSDKDENGQAMAVNLIRLRMRQWQDLQKMLPDFMGDFKREPMFFGLQLYVKQKQRPLMLNYLHKYLRSFPSSSISAANILSGGSSIPDYNDVLLFSTPGTGKTYKILKHLSSRRGMYFVAPNIQPSSDGPTMLQSTRGGASSDTSSLFEDLKSLRRTELLVQNFHIDSLVESLKCARFVLWDVFRKMIDPGMEYAQWTQLQVSCSKHSDPFDATWRLQRLLVSDNWFRTLSKSQEVMQVCCFDEAQSVFDDPLAEAILKRLWNRSVDSMDPMDCILSGTSLQLTKANAFVEGGFRFPGIDEDSHLSVTDLGRVTSHNFWKFFRDYLNAILMETRVLQDKTKPLLARAGRSLDFSLNLTEELQQELLELRNEDSNPQSLHSFLATECTFFFGRYRFSALRHPKRNSKRYRDRKEGLWDQLDKVQDASWVGDLYWMAIRADVFSQSSIVEDKTARLVSEGFAMVESMESAQTSSGQTPSTNVRDGETKTEGRLVKVVLCEPLAVYAVLKYLKEKEKYDGWMDRFFSLLQIDNVDQSTIGKITEYIITCKLDNFLSSDPQPTGLLKKPDDTIIIHRRTKLYEIFSNAHRFDLSKNEWVQNTINYQNYFLLGCKGNTATKSSTKVKPWLQAITSTNSNYSRFFFPEPEDGPDLMFVIGNENKKLLCVLQLKTGKLAHRPKEFESAMKSLVKGLKGGLYSTYTGPIMFIVVVTSRDVHSDRFKKITKDLLLADGGYSARQDHDYFGFIDKTSSPGVWGDTFYELLRLMKKTK